MYTDENILDSSCETKGNMSGVFRFWPPKAEINRAVSEHIQCMIGGLAGNIDTGYADIAQ